MAGAIVSCAVCGGAIPPGGKKSRKFCSPACYHKAQHLRMVKVGVEPFHVYPCAHCGKSVNRKPSTKRNGEKASHVFCERTCYEVWRVGKRLRRTVNRRHCARCGCKVPTASAKYCGWDCRVADKKPKPCTCKSCGVMFSAIKPIKRASGMDLVAYNGAATCSPACHNAWIRSNPERKRKISEAFRLDKHPAWQGGSHRDGFRGHEWQKIAERVRERARRRCEHCGMSEADHLARYAQRLHVNHKVPFHQFTRKAQANRMSNLEALCRSCHTKADARWRRENAVQFTLALREQKRA